MPVDDPEPLVGALKFFENLNHAPIGRLLAGHPGHPPGVGSAHLHNFLHDWLHGAPLFTVIDERGEKRSIRRAASQEGSSQVRPAGFAILATNLNNTSTTCQALFSFMAIGICHRRRMDTRQAGSITSRIRFFDPGKRRRVSDTPRRIVQTGPLAGRQGPF